MSHRTPAGLCRPGSPRAAARAARGARSRRAPRGRPARRGTPPPRPRQGGRGLLLHEHGARARRDRGSLPLGLAEHDRAAGRATASFSAAIASRVAPSTSVCSSATFVRTTTRVASSTFVASKRPRARPRRPRPRPPPRNATSAAAVSVSNCVAPSRSAAGRTISSTGSRSTSVRRRGSARTTSARGARGRRRSGGRRRGRLLHHARRRRLAVRPDDVHGRQVACGWPSSASNACIRSRPKPSVGQGESQATLSMRRVVTVDGTRHVPRGIEVAPICRHIGAPRTRLAVRERRPIHSVNQYPRGAPARRGSARASRAPPRRRLGRVRDEPLVREHPLGPGDLLPSRPRSASTSPPSPPLRPDDRGEDALLLVSCDLDPDAAPPEDLRGLLHPVERRGRRRASRPGPASRRRSARLARGQVRPDLLGHVRHQRVQEREEALERRQRGRARVLVPVVEPLLDRLGVPVAEVVEREVVEDAGRGGEVEPAPRLLDGGAHGVEPREDPALLERRGTERGRHALRVLEDEPRDVPELDRELAPLLDRLRRVADVLRRRDLEEAVARRVGAVRLDRLHRVDARAEALRHPPPSARAPSSG